MQWQMEYSQKQQIKNLTNLNKKKKIQKLKLQDKKQRQSLHLMPTKFTIGFYHFKTLTQPTNLLVKE